MLRAMTTYRLGAAALLLCLAAGCTRARPTEIVFQPGECPEETVAREEVLDDGSRRTWCERPSARGEAVRHGPFAAWHPGGEPASQGAYVDGLEHGMWTMWFENGQKSQEGAFRAGKPHGRWTAWLEDGTRVYLMDFRDGEIVCGEDPLQPKCE
jgi:hypothetical protein